ncbi:hypothetical protein FOZ60_017683 [Perkinsus olseni]|uniref:Uncharacterized protein n=1 Tax=Perkinsus olseni TaxID=32597 RepID=A0A7J6P593_PEROL|nr:hypothetical protein FOZ60_017683 [Perkinsus olseni]
MIKEAIVYSNGRCEGIGDDKCGYIIHAPPRHNYTAIHQDDGQVIRMQLEFTTSKYRPYLEELSRCQSLFNPACCITSPLHESLYVYNNHRHCPAMPLLLL